MAINFRLLNADEIELRVGIQNPNGASLLLYKDSRCDMMILDEAVGAENWQRHHTRDNANCTISIWDAIKGQWISKEDTGTASRTEAEKGLASDSFKRAGVNWGIGRELYSSPFVWVPMKKLPTREKNGKIEVMADHLRVSHIEYDEPKRRIVKLAITNDDSGEIIFTWSRAMPTTTPLPAGTLDTNDDLISASTTPPEGFSKAPAASVTVTKYNAVPAIREIMANLNVDKDVFAALRQSLVDLGKIPDKSSLEMTEEDVAQLKAALKEVYGAA